MIGLGRMGRCLVQGLLSSGKTTPKGLFFTTKHSETALVVEKDLGITRCDSNSELVTQCDIIVVAVKPQNVMDVLSEIKGLSFKGKTVISIVASYSTQSFESVLPKGAAVIRAMPNTPAFVGAGITAICGGSAAKEKDWANAQEIFAPVGKVVRADERNMDAVTGLSGCGPAYLFMILESLMDGGIKVGLPRDLARELAAHTVLGAAKMLLETQKHPAALKDEVTTPAGCTIDGLLALEEGGLRVTLIKAVVKATERARCLAVITQDKKE